MLIRILHLLALIVWIGEIVFLSFIAAPAAFRLLPREQAGPFVGAVFPTYYLVGCACGLVLFATSLLLRRTASARRAWTVQAVLAGAMLVANVYAAASVQPRAAALRPQLQSSQAAPGVREEFDRLHRLAVVLNAGVLLAGLGASGITAASMRP